MWKHASLNRRYRLVWNRVRQCWSVAPEIASGQGKAAAGASEPVQADCILPLRALVVAIGCAFSLPALALDAGALPTGGTVVAGQASLSQSGSTLTVNQSTDRAILEWQSFNIGKDAAVHFNQNSASSVALNRVTGGTRSEIYGSLTANGQVYLVNSAGVLFGNTAQVDVGGIVASTLNISNTDFMNGTNRFVQDGSAGEVINQGRITARDGGTVALIGSSVSNSGQIVANGGNVALVAGQQVTFAAGANGHLQIAVDATEAQALVHNGGLIQADGGQVILTAQGANALASAVVSNTGTIQARTVAEREGKILLLADFDSGTTQVAGTLDASAPDGGNGGFIETSAAHVTVADSTKVTTKAASGQTGTWLIDPNDFTVAASGGDMTGATVAANLVNTNFTIETATMGTAGGNGDIHINDAISWSADTTLTLNAERNINVNAAITATGTNAGLALNYGGTDGNSATTPVSGSDYNVNAPITLSGANSTLAINGNAYTLIHSMAQLDALDAAGTGVSGYYALAQDLDASGTTYGQALVGTSNNAFTGTFTGLGHTISNLTIDAGSTDYVGLFGYIGSGSVVRNIGLVGGSITGNSYVGGLVGWNVGNISNAYATGSVTGGAQVGGLVGMNGGNISNAYATGSVTGGDKVGGLVGVNVGNISNAHASGSVTGSSSVGGLVGSNEGSISKAYASGSVSGTAYDAGGLVGTNHYGSISNAYALGSVSGTLWVGGLVGYNAGGGTISNAYATGSVTGSSTVGGLVGSNLGTISNVYWDSSSTGQSNALGGGSGTATQITSSNRYNHSSYNDFGTWSLVAGTSNVYAASDANGVQWIMIEGQTRPFLASEYSTSIGNAHQLQLMAYNLGVTYTLVNDIDASATAGSNASGMWSTAGFVSVGDESNPFTGQLDGQSHTIGDLLINRSSTNYVGLFGYTGSGSVIRNIGLVGGSVLGQYYVGGLVGWSNLSTISNAYTTGSVSGNGSVGGLIGWSHGSALSNVYSTGNVSGISQYTGGLVGIVSVGSISNAYATGSVSGGNQFSGGLVGRNGGGNISNTYATGSVSGGVQVGGLVGENTGSITSSFYATTDANGNVINNGGATTGVFSGNNLGTGTTWLDLTNPTTFSGWDTSLWTFAGAGSSVEGYGVVLPYLTNVTRSADIVTGTLFQSGQGTTNNPYTITSWQQLAGINRVLSGGYIFNLLNNLGSGTTGYAVFASSTANGGAGWNPLGTDINPFTGTFDGQSHTIADLIVNRSGTDYIGLFGYTGSGSVIRDIGLVGGSVSGRNYVGGLVGMNGGNISNAYATGRVSGSQLVGGLVGFNLGSLSNVYATGNISGGGNVGGLVGYNYQGTISNAYATGSVSGGGYVGGLVGYNYQSTISNAYATGSVSGSGNVGGLVGYYVGGNITSSFYATTDANGNAINNSGATTGVFTGNGYGTAKTAAELTQLSTFTDAGWDIDDAGGTGKVWRIYEGQTGPLLRSFLTAVTISTDASASNKTYDGTVASGTFGTYDTSLGNSVNAGQLLGNLTYLTTEKDAGTYSLNDGTLVLGGLYSGQQGYDISYAGSAQPLTIEKASITVSSSDVSKTYDGTLSAIGSVVLTGGTLFNSDSLSGGTFAFTDANAGTNKAVTTSGVTVSDGNNGGNYAVTYVDNTSSTIDKASITVTANGGTSTYGDNGLLNPGLTAAGLVNGEDESVLTGLANSFGIDNTTDAGSHVLTVSGTLSNGNYVVTQTVDGTWVVDPKAISVVASGGSSTYGDTGLLDPGFTATGLANGQDESVLTGLTNSFGIDNTSNAGSYTLTVDGTLSNGNYVVTQTTDGTWVVDRKTLTVKANDDRRSASSQAYSGGNGVTYSGFVNGEDVSVLNGSLVYGGSAQGASRAGSYALSVSGLSGDNYAIQYVDGRLLLTSPVNTPSGGELERSVPTNTGRSSPLQMSLVQASAQPLYLTIMNDPISAAD